MIWLAAAAGATAVKRQRLKAERDERAEVFADVVHGI